MPHRLVGDYPPDHPGENTTLKPHDAPPWMRELVRAAAAGNVGAHVRSVMGIRADEDAARQAAVLVAIWGTGDTETLPDDARVLMLHRAPTMRSHAGQLAFPGGGIDPEDTSIVDAALREAWEETGLDRHAVTPIAQLTPVPVRSTSFPVHPVVAHWHTPARTGEHSPEETDDVFTIPIRDLINPDNRLTVRWGKWSGPAFWVNGYLLWGFTAVVVDAILRNAGWAPTWDGEPVLDLPDALARSRNNEKQEPELK